MSSSDEENTEKYSDHSLDNARINSPSEIMSTPSTKQLRLRKDRLKSAEKEGESDDSDGEWRMLLTRSIQQAAEETPAKLMEGPTQSVKKHLEKTAQIKNKQGCTYENMCPICLNKYDPVRGSLECLHQFCFTCISEWCKSSTICPCCRRPFTSILKLVSSPTRATIRQTERINVEQKEFVVNSEYDYYTCYQCGLGDNEHVLLICDGCDFYCCHVYCDQELSYQIPDGDWFCIYCKEAQREGEEGEGDGEEEETQVESEEENSPEKAVAQRTRSRQSSHLRGHLVTLRNMRRR